MCWLPGIFTLDIQYDTFNAIEYIERGEGACSYLLSSAPCRTCACDTWGGKGWKSVMTEHQYQKDLLDYGGKGE